MKQFLLFSLLFFILSAPALREVVLDTETTGVAANREEDPDRITEIACLELEEGVPTGKIYQTYLNPEKKLSKKITEITGLTGKFLEKHPKFADIVDHFLAFIGDSSLIIHNAPFDVRFLNAELARVGKPPLKNPIIDTLPWAREKFGRPANLDALCERLGIDLSRRTKHGALIDCELLAQVYARLKEPNSSNFYSQEATMKMPQVLSPNRLPSPQTTA
jgi:DNA polymerase-3 subunit epsilon